MSRTLVPELKVLYPSITTFSIAHSLEVRVDSMKTDTVTFAVMTFAVIFIVAALSFFPVHALSTIAEHFSL